MSSQFGAVCDQTDYDTNVHTISLGADLEATEQLKLFANALYNDAKAEWKNLSLTAPSIIDDPSVFLLYTFDIGHTTQYSKLKFKQAEFNLGGTYHFTPAFYTTAQAGVQWFIDDAPYVYGDQDGTAYRAFAGLGYRF